MKKTLLALSLSLLSTFSYASGGEPNVYDNIMSHTVGQYSVGDSKYHYGVSGALNYVYGFNDMDSGFQNSYINLNTSTSLSHGVDVNVAGGVREIYSVSSDDYKTKLDINVGLSRENHEIKIGYDKFLANQILGTKIKTNTDPSLTKNAIGQQLTAYKGYAEYNFAFKSSMLTAAIDFDGQLYGAISTYFNGTDIALHIFDAEDYYNVFLDIGHTFGKALKVTAGAGVIADKLSFIVDGSYFVTDGIVVYGNALGDEEYASTTLGVSYSYGAASIYVEGIVELTDPRETGKSKDGVMIGAKFMF